MDGQDAADASRTGTRTQAERAKARDLNHHPAERPAGWIVSMTGAVPSDPRDVAAGPIAREALALARDLGFGEGRQARPVTTAELNALDLPPSALGIAPGAGPWWDEQ